MLKLSQQQKWTSHTCKRSRAHGDITIGQTDQQKEWHTQIDEEIVRHISSLVGRQPDSQGCLGQCSKRHRLEMAMITPKVS